jgi:hypothetical protein
MLQMGARPLHEPSSEKPVKFTGLLCRRDVPIVGKTPWRRAGLVLPGVALQSAVV